MLRHSALVIFTFGAAVAAFCQTATITGTVQTPAGKPVKNAHVSINVRPPTDITAPNQPFNAEATTGPDGTFSITGVPPGTYAVCPTALSSNLLPPCLWGDEIQVTVTSDQPVQVPPIQMKTGVDLHVRVEDPNRTRAKSEGITPGAGMMLAVRSPNGKVVPIAQTAADGNGFDHHLIVPMDTDLLLLASSGTYSLRDSDGSAVDKTRGLSRTIKLQAGTPQHKETISID